MLCSLIFPQGDREESWIYSTVCVTCVSNWLVYLFYTYSISCVYESRRTSSFIVQITFLLSWKFYYILKDDQETMWNKVVEYFIFLTYDNLTSGIVTNTSLPNNEGINSAFLSINN